MRYNRMPMAEWAHMAVALAANMLVDEVIVDVSLTGKPMEAAFMG